MTDERYATSVLDTTSSDWALANATALGELLAPVFEREGWTYGLAPVVPDARCLAEFVSELVGRCARGHELSSGRLYVQYPDDPEAEPNVYLLLPTEFTRLT